MPGGLYDILIFQTCRSAPRRSVRLITTMAHNKKNNAKGRLYRGVDSTDRKLARRNALIESGLELFGTKGYRACSVKMVCDHVNLTERYFYESFANREALLAAVFKSQVIELDNRLRQIVEDESGDPSSRARGVVENFFHFIKEDERRGRVLMFEILGVSPEVDRIYQSAVRNLAVLVEHPNLDLFRHRDSNSNGRRVLSIGLVGAITQIAIQWILDDFSTPITTVIDDSLELFRAVDAFEHNKIAAS